MTELLGPDGKKIPKQLFTGSASVRHLKELEFLYANTCMQVIQLWSFLSTLLVKEHGGEYTLSALELQEYVNEPHKLARCIADQELATVRYVVPEDAAAKTAEEEKERGN